MLCLVNCILRKLRKLRIDICARFAQDSLPMRNICARFAQDCTYFSNAQDLRKIVLIFSNVQYMCKIYARLYLFLQRAIYAQDRTNFSNAQYMCKIYAGLYFFPQCAIMRKICARLYLFPQCTVYAQDLRKIVLISPMRNMICARLYFFPQCTIYA